MPWNGPDSGEVGAVSPSLGDQDTRRGAASFNDPDLRVDGAKPEEHCPDDGPGNLQPNDQCDVPGFRFNTAKEPGEHLDGALVQNRAFIVEPQVHARELVANELVNGKLVDWWDEAKADNYFGYFASPQEGSAAQGASPVPDVDFEFSVRNVFSTYPYPGSAGRSDCFYNYLGAGDLSKAQAQMLRTHDMGDFKDPIVQSLRHEQPFTPQWQWAAEGAVCAADYWGNEDDFSALYTRLGLWKGNLGVDSAGNGTWDQEFLFFPVQGDYAAQHATLWQDNKAAATAENLVIFANRTGAPLTWHVEGADDETVKDQIWGDVVVGPTVEPVAGGSRGRMLVRWRNVDGIERACNPAPTSSTPGPQVSTRPCFYQQIAYQLDRYAGLALRWGSKRSVNPQDVDPATQPIDPEPVTSCNQSDIVCYRHEAPGKQPLFVYPEW